MRIRQTSSHSSPAVISVVGAGRLGRPLAGALRAAGFDVHGPSRRGDDIAPADVVLLCVPDAEIAGAATAAAGRAPLVGHTSGATPADTADFSIHPLQTFHGDEEPSAFYGVTCAVGGRTEAAVDAATMIAERLGARPLRLADEHRPAYHAAASIASNFLVTLEDAAERVAVSAGFSPAEARTMLAPLVRRTVDNWAQRGPADALTGPIARGDERTVERQRAAVAEADEALVPLFDALSESTRELARRRARVV